MNSQRFKVDNKRSIVRSIIKGGLSLHFDPPVKLQANESIVLDFVNRELIRADGSVVKAVAKSTFQGVIRR